MGLEAFSALRGKFNAALLLSEVTSPLSPATPLVAPVTESFQVEACVS